MGEDQKTARSFRYARSPWMKDAGGAVLVVSELDRDRIPSGNTQIPNWPHPDRVSARRIAPLLPHSRHIAQMSGKHLGRPADDEGSSISTMQTQGGEEMSAVVGILCATP